MKEIVVSVIIALVSSAGFWAFVTNKIEKHSAVSKALGALLRHQMFDIYEIYRCEEVVPADILEEIDELHSAYSALGFNHTGDRIWEEIMKKPPC